MNNLNPEYEKALELWIKFGLKANIPLKIRREIHQDFYKWLVSKILERSFLDIKHLNTSIENRESAINFFRSDCCKLFCNDLGLRYNTVRQKVEDEYAKTNDNRAT